MFKILASILIVFLTASDADAQSFFYDDKYYDADLLWETGVSFGSMNALADVGEQKGNGLSLGYYNWKSAQINGSIYFGIIYKNIIEGRLEATKGTIAGNDKNSNSAYIRSRNLNFKSKILDVSFIGAFHPLMLINTENLPFFSPYLMAGLGIFSFYPKTLYNGKWIPLRRMNTEGQTSAEYPARKQYNLRAISIPIGLGLKYEHNAKFNFRMEGLYRLTTSDYLDDVSTTYVDRSIFPTESHKLLAHRYTELNPQLDRTGWARGNATNKDIFFTINLRIGYVLGRNKIPINYNPTQ